MAQEQVWDKEYRDSKLLSKENKPQADVVRFVDFLKKEEKISLSGLNVLDLGSGTGRNSFYFVELGNIVTGIEISRTAVNMAKENAREAGLSISYIKQSMGEKFPVENESVDLVLDVTSSNSLSEMEREVYLSEMNRVLKSGGYIFVKTLAKEGDTNAKFLLKNNPGPEKDTYIMPELGLTERVFSRENFTLLYEKYFTILQLEKKTSYTRMNNRVYKRNFWLAYLRK